MTFFQDDYGLKAIDGEDDDDDGDADEDDDEDEQEVLDDTGGSEGYEIVEGHDAEP